MSCAGNGALDAAGKCWRNAWVQEQFPALAADAKRRIVNWVVQAYCHTKRECNRWGNREL